MTTYIVVGFIAAPLAVLALVYAFALARAAKRGDQIEAAADSREAARRHGAGERETPAPSTTDTGLSPRTGRGG